MSEMTEEEKGEYAEKYMNDLITWGWNVSNNVMPGLEVHKKEEDVKGFDNFRIRNKIIFGNLASSTGVAGIDKNSTAMSGMKTVRMMFLFIFLNGVISTLACLHTAHKYNEFHPGNVTFYIFPLTCFTFFLFMYLKEIKSAFVHPWLMIQFSLAKEKIGQSKKNIDNFVIEVEDLIWQERYGTYSVSKETVEETKKKEKELAGKLSDSYEDAKRYLKMGTKEMKSRGKRMGIMVVFAIVINFLSLAIAIFSL